VTPEQRAALRRIDRQFDALRAMPAPIPARERYRYGVEDARAGSCLRLRGELCQVLSLSEYREKSGSWWELECFGLESGETLWVEWERDDEVEISVSGPALSLQQIGVSAGQVEEMSDEEEGRISFGGRTYHYDDDYGATYFRDPSSAGEPVYFYDFETRDGRHGLTVEEWGDASQGYEYEAFASESMGPDEIEVVALSGSGARS
jgi:hypothetical protein